MSVPGLIVASILFLIGLVGTVVPVIPGVVMVFAGTLVYGLIAGFDGGLNLLFYLGQGVAVVLAFLTDYAAGAWGTKKFGGSRAAILGSIAGILVGVLIFGPFGIIIGPFAGAFLGEYYYRRDLEAALRAGIGTVIGFLGGTLIKLLIAVTMITWFFITIF